MIDAIGGYFGMEECGAGIFPHRDGILLNTGRNALEYILRDIAKIDKIWIPHFTCSVILEPIVKLGIRYEIYEVNEEYEISSSEHISLGEAQYLLVNNYFGIKDAYIKSLAEKYGERLIVDCAQAFFAKPIPGIKSFYSCRKFVGVADGGIAYGVSPEMIRQFEHDDSSKHSSHLQIRRNHGAEAGFKEYQKNEQNLSNQPIRRMSKQTLEQLESIDYERIIATRSANFHFIDKVLQTSNLFSIPDETTFSCPMTYPYVTTKASFIRRDMAANRIYVPTYWPTIPGSQIQCHLHNQLLPLPIDQRYGIKEMEQIIDRI